MTERSYPWGEPQDDEFDQYEEDGPMDLEDQLEAALDRAFPAHKEIHGAP